MEYEQHPDGTLTPLPKQNIDTGMGLERLAAIVQDVPNRSVYETDGYQAIMAWVAEESGVAFGESEQATKAHRVLADHGRGMTFLVADGVKPSNEGRGYVLRRVIRRAVQQAQTIGLEELWRLTDVVVEQMGDAFPELREHAADIQRVIKTEEEQFERTMTRGMAIFDELASDTLSGEAAFKLHDTYGFPIELTRELALERGMPVDEDRFTELMQEQRERSRSTVTVPIRLIGDVDFKTDFVGYEKLDVLTQIGALRRPRRRDVRGEAPRVAVLSRGRRPGARHGLRRAGRRVEPGRGRRRRAPRRGRPDRRAAKGRASPPAIACAPSCPGRCASRRWRTTRRRTSSTRRCGACSATTSSRRARRCGPTSFASTSRTSSALSEEQRTEVERIVNEQVFANHAVRIFETPIDEARKLGAQMLFGEKYGDIVRVVEIDGFSRELCGGTHVRSTAEIGPVVILSEGSVGSGVRRIEAVTAGEAYALLHERAREADELRAELANAPQGGEGEAGREGAEADFTVTRETEPPAASTCSSSTSRAAIRWTSPTGSSSNTRRPR